MDSRRIRREFFKHSLSGSPCHENGIIRARCDQWNRDL